MTDAFDEIQHSIAQERTTEIWQKYGPFIIGLAVTIIAFTALFSGVSAWKTHVNTQETDAAFAYYEGEEDLAAVTADQSDLPMAPLLYLQAADAAFGANDQDKAQALLEAAQNAKASGPAEQSAQDLATLLLARMGAADLPSGKGSAFGAQYDIEHAVALAGENKFSEAATLLQARIDEGRIPTSILRVMHQLAHVYQMRATENADADKDAGATE